MPKLFSINKLSFQGKESSPENFDIHTAIPRLSKEADAKHLDFDVRCLLPGKYSYPYHFHHNAEELMVILSGSIKLRTQEGFQELQAGDIIFFEKGKTGAHQFFNHTDSPCLYLDIRTSSGTDICEYPDSGKIAILPLLEAFKKGAPANYFDGEEQVDKKWEAAK